MKKIKNLFSTPKKTIITIVSIVAVLGLIGTATAFTISSAAEQNAISKAAAQNYALADAGIAPEDAKILKTDFGFDEGHFAYEVEFTANGTEYDYLINSEDGTVISKESETFDIEADTSNKSSAEATQSANEISLESAKQKALKDAGLSEADVTFKKTKLDRDDNSLNYDIDFYTKDAEYEYEINAITGDIIDKSVEKFKRSSNNTSNESTQNSGLIGLNSAKNKALKNAGLSASEVTFTKTKLDRDEIIPVYDIEFYTSNTEYDYEINAKTGDIIEKSTEKINKPGHHTSSTPSNNSGVISIDTAKNKALKDAGLTASKVTFTKAKLDRDDGISVYEIEFYTSNMEYDYEIDAKTGSVISKDTEKIKSTNKNSAPSSANNYIGVDKAKSNAVNHAGFSLSEVTFTKAKLEKDDGRRVYEIEFYKNNMEYEYTIDAVSGKILEYDSEYDD